jgi:hypothetical protein
MRLDASREFEVFTKIVTQIKMHANMIGDTDVLLSLMETLANLTIGMFATLPQDADKEVLRVLLEQKYDEILEANQLRRTNAN